MKIKYNVKDGSSWWNRFEKKYQGKLEDVETTKRLVFRLPRNLKRILFKKESQEAVEILENILSDKKLEKESLSELFQVLIANNDRNLSFRKLSQKIMTIAPQSDMDKVSSFVKRRIKKAITALKSNQHYSADHADKNSDNKSKKDLDSAKKPKKNVQWKDDLDSTIVNRDSKKRKIPDSTTQKIDALPQSIGQAAKKSKLEKKANTSNTGGDSPIRQQEQLREFLGLTQEQFDKIDPEVREIMSRNAMPKIELFSKMNTSTPESSPKPIDSSSAKIEVSTGVSR